MTTKKKETFKISERHCGTSGNLKNKDASTKSAEKSNEEEKLVSTEIERNSASNMRATTKSSATNSMNLKEVLKANKLSPRNDPRAYSIPFLPFPRKTVKSY